MKTKLFKLIDDVIDENGKKHTITLVGKLTEDKETVLNAERAEMNVEKCSDGVLIYNKTNKYRLLQYAFSICHPEDEYDEEVGVKIATKRIKNMPFGSLKTYQLNTLRDNQVNFILLGVLLYIKKNIKKFIKQ